MIYYWSIVLAEGCKAKRAISEEYNNCLCVWHGVSLATFHKVINCCLFWIFLCFIFFVSIISKVFPIFLRQCISKMWWSWEKAWPSWKRFKGKINVTISAPAEEFFGGRHENNYSELSYPFWLYIYLKWQY